MPPAASLAVSVLAPKLSPLVTSIVGEIGAKFVGNTGVNSMGSPVNAIIEGFGNAFNKIFGRKRKRRPPISQRPLPFALTPYSSYHVRDHRSTQHVRDHRSTQHVIDCATPGLSKVIDCLSRQSLPSAPLTPVAEERPGSQSSTSSWGYIDELIRQAESLLKPKKDSNGKDIPPSEADKLAAQKMMSDAQNLFQMWSKLMAVASDNFGKIIANIRC